MIPSKTWRECIKKIYEVDPLCRPRCGVEMKIISFITDPPIIRKIVEHLNLWKKKPSRDQPNREFLPENNETVYEPFDDCWPVCGSINSHAEPSVVLN